MTMSTAVAARANGGDIAAGVARGATAGATTGQIVGSLMVAGPGERAAGGRIGRTMGALGGGMGGGIARAVRPWAGVAASVGVPAAATGAAALVVKGRGPIPLATVALLSLPFGAGGIAGSVAGAKGSSVGMNLLKLALKLR
jgi:hypothetical protein